MQNLIIDSLQIIFVLCVTAFVLAAYCGLLDSSQITERPKKPE